MSNLKVFRPSSNLIVNIANDFNSTNIPKVLFDITENLNGNFPVTTDNPKNLIGGRHYWWCEQPIPHGDFPPFTLNSNDNMPVSNKNYNPRNQGDESPESCETGSDIQIGTLNINR